jgi:hypothetical protein
VTRAQKPENFMFFLMNVSQKTPLNERGEEKLDGTDPSNLREFWECSSQVKIDVDFPAKAQIDFFKIEAVN